MPSLSHTVRGTCDGWHGQNDWTSDSPDIQHFIVVYDIDTAAVEVTTYPRNRAREAVDRFRQLELRDLMKSGRSRTRILFFSAYSEAALRVTHAHYFAGKAGRLEDESWDKPLLAFSHRTPR